MTWSNSTHLGAEYAALLVEPGYVPPASTVALPNEGGAVLAVTVVDGRPPFWQTGWFRLSLVLVGSFALLAFYRWRLHEFDCGLVLCTTCRPSKGATMAEETCSHIKAISSIKDPKRHECDECVKIGSRWVHLRTCQTCGATLCCDNSPNRHATKHAHVSGHPVIASAESGERWLFCYTDDAFAEH